MKIKKLKLKNFRAFASFEGEFQKDINVLIGLNGHGKTSLLDAISVAYGQFFTAIGTAVDRGINDSEIHLKKFRLDDTYTMEHQFDVEVECECFGSSKYEFPGHWMRKRTSIKGRTTQVKELKDIGKALQNEVQNNSNVPLPVFGFYGTGRLWKQKSLSSKKVESLSSSSRLEGYRNCMDPESSYSAFAKWLKDETIADYERRLSIIERSGFNANSVISGNSVRGRLLKALENAVNSVLEPSGWTNIRYSATIGDIVASHHEQGDIPVSSLSDGVRNMIGLVSDIAYRCIRLNPQLESDATLETEGVVLIDEVDMHLHPQWQLNVVNSLRKAFPNIQFIVTTHSPQVIGGVSPKNISLIRKQGNDYFLVSPKQAYGLSSNDILDEIMSQSSQKTSLSRNEHVETRLREIQNLIEDKEYETAERKIEALKLELNGDIPELIEATISIDLSKWNY